MGLDLYLYRLSKPSYTEPDFGFGTEKYSKHEVENDGVGCPTFFKFAEKITEKVKYIDFDKIIKEFKTKDTLYHDDHDEDSIYFVDDEKYTTYSPLKLSFEDVEQNYTYEVDEEFYAVDEEEIAYQRKGLTDKGFRMLPKNCSFCDDLNLVKELTKEGLHPNFVARWGEDTVFHPWW